MPYKFIKAENVKGKTLVIRVDLNSDIVKGKPVISARIREHAKTIQALSKKGARLVILAHQGRKGDDDFVSLEMHAKVLERLLKRKILFVTWKENFAQKIRQLKNSQVILLENTRFQESEAIEKTPEEHSKEDWIQEIAGCANYFVQDALSVCHRPHASVVGFSPLLKCFVGIVLEKELSALKKYEEVKKNRLFVLGGAKIEDSLKIIDYCTKDKKAEEFALGGLLGELFLKANGKNLGAKEKFFEEKGFNKLIPLAQEVMKNTTDKISLPLDVAGDDCGKRKEILIEELPSKLMLKDIGEKTIYSMQQKIKKSEFIVFNGPMGIYEEKAFEEGTKQLFKVLAKGKKHCILGGGDTETAIEKLGFEEKNFYHVSLAGKALLEYLAGKKLAGLEILK